MHVNSGLPFILVVICVVLPAISSSEPAAVEQSSSASSSAPLAPEVARPATRVERARLVDAGTGGVYLLVREKFSLAWRSTGQALAELGLVVDDRDWWSGVYDILYPVQGIAAVPSGKQQRSMLSRLGLATGDAAKGYRHYQLKLEKDVGGKTRIIVRDHEGRSHNSSVAVHILTLLEGQLNLGAVPDDGLGERL